VLANRCRAKNAGIYAGRVYGILGRGDRELLVDTKNPPQFKLVAEPNATIPEDTSSFEHSFS
jgi:hypothetical protein